MPHSLHLPHYHVDSDRNLKFLYGIRLLHVIVDKSAFFFLPIFLFNLGFSQQLTLWSGLTPLQSGLVLIAIYYLIFRVFVLLTVSIFADTFRHFGQRLTLLLAHVFLVLVFYALQQSVAWPSLVLVAAVLNGIRTAFFWISNHTLIASGAARNHVAQDLGVMQIVIQFGTIFAPAIGGFVILLFGFDTLFSAAMATIGVSSLLTLGLHNKKLNRAMNWSRFYNLLKNRSFRRQSLSFIGRYINDSTLSLWPVYVFLLLGTVDRVGTIYSISMFVAMLLTFFIAIYIDKAKSRKSFFTSGGLLSLTWLARLNVFSVVGIALVDAIEKLTANFHWLFYDSLLYKAGKGNDALVYFVTREIVISVFAIIFWISLIVIFITTVSGWQSLFVIAAVATLISALMSDTVQA